MDGPFRRRAMFEHQRACVCLALASALLAASAHAQGQPAPGQAPAPESGRPRRSRNRSSSPPRAWSNSSSMRPPPSASSPRRPSRTRRPPTSATCCERCPGVNVTQVSARDVNINSRGATSTLATSQLALVDGRCIYLDFFGMVMWDLVPTNPHEIKQIEVIRGPASAVWGANAMTGVVNIITQVPARAGGGAAQRVDDRRGHLPAHRPGRDARRRVALLRQRFARRGGERPRGHSRCPPATSRRTRCRVPSAPSTTPFRTAVSALHRTPARRSRSSTRGWTTTSQNGGTVTFNGGVAGTEGSSTPASGRSTSRTGRGWAISRHDTAGRRVASRSSPTCSTATPSTCVARG